MRLVISADLAKNINEAGQNPISLFLESISSEFEIYMKDWMKTADKDIIVTVELKSE